MRKRQGEDIGDAGRGGADSKRTEKVREEEHIEENALSAENEETEELGRVADLHEGEEVLCVRLQGQYGEGKEG